MDYYTTLYLIALFFLIGIMILSFAWRAPQQIYVMPSYDYGYQPIRRLDYNPWWGSVGPLNYPGPCVGCRGGGLPSYDIRGGGGGHHH